MRETQIAYFDYAATSFIKPSIVHKFMHAFYSANSVNVGRGNHALLLDGQNIVNETREMIRSLFHGTNEHITVFTPSATEALNIIIQGQKWEEQQNIYISPFEHNAVYRVVKHLEHEKKVRIIQLAVDKNSLKFSVDKINRQFAEEKPNCVIVSHISNVCGNIAPIQQIGKLTKEYGGTFVVDCAQSAGLIETDIVKSRADYMVFAGHKTLYGPFGCSGFVCKKSVSLKPLIYGGTGIDSANEYMPTNLPTKFEAGSTNLLAISGLHAALTWHNQTGIDNIRHIENENYKKLISILSSFKNIEIKGNSETSTSIVSCLFKNLPVDSVERILSQNGIIVRSGLQCAPLAHKFLGTHPEGTVRFSVGYFNNDNDFACLNRILNELKE